MDIFYRLKSPTDLADLNDSFSLSKCKGFYLFLDNIQLNKKKKAFSKKTTNYLNTIKSLKKDIILTYDFNKKFNRPDYHSPNLNKLNIRRLEEKLRKNLISKIKFEQEKEFFNTILKNNEEKIKELKKLEDKNYCFTYFREIFDYYSKVKKYLEFEGMGRFLTQSNRIKTNILGLEVPLIANYKFEELKDPYFKPIQDSITKINKHLVNFCKNSRREELIYPLTVMTKDIKEKNQFYKIQLNYLKNFKKILIWVIDSNELYSTKENEKLYFNIVGELSKHYTVLIKYVGIKQLQKYKKEISTVSIIFREDAYSGYNINIRRYAKPSRTRNILDPKDIKHKNDIGLSKGDLNAKFQCNCSICSINGIHTYKKVLDLYHLKRIEEDNKFSKEISPKREVKDEEKYKRKMSRRLQAKYRKIHNFETADNLIFMDLDDFIKKYPKISKQISLR